MRSSQRVARALRGGRPGSFTLVELLVVIAIIAVLAGIILSAGNTVVNLAKRAKAQNMANQLQTATQAYFTEYSVYPVPTGVTADFIRLSVGLEKRRRSYRGSRSGTRRLSSHASGVS